MAHFINPQSSIDYELRPEFEKVVIKFSTIFWSIKIYHTHFQELL